MYKLNTLAQLNKVLTDIFDTKILNNGDIVNLVRASIINYNMNNKKDWVVESSHMKHKDKNKNKDKAKDKDKANDKEDTNVYFDIDSKYDSNNKCRIAKTTNYELSLLKWDGKQKTLFHTPQNRYRFLVPLYGSLLETHYDFINVSNYSYTHIITNNIDDMSMHMPMSMYMSMLMPGEDILKKYSKDIIKCNELVLPIYDISYLDNNVSIHCIENNSNTDVIALHINIIKRNYYD